MTRLSLASMTFLALFVLCPPIFAQETSNPSSQGSSEPTQGPKPKDLLDKNGSAVTQRTKDINDAINMLEELSKDQEAGLTEGQRLNLEAAVEGLRRMAKKKRFRTKPVLGSEEAAAETPTPQVKKPDAGPFPTGGGGREGLRDATEDSWIDFPQKDWEKEGDPPSWEEPAPLIPTGYLGLDDDLSDPFKKRAIATLAIVLWHEWQHASDGTQVQVGAAAPAGGPVFDECAEIQRHICIIKGQIEVAKKLHESANIPVSGSGGKLGDKFKGWATAQIAGLKRRCLELNCEPCECQQVAENPWPEVL